jgi:hypothetical protein
MGSHGLLKAGRLDQLIKYLPVQKVMEQKASARGRSILLGFLALALGILLVARRLQPEQKLVYMWAGVAIFALVTVAVTVLLWFSPPHIRPGMKRVETIINIPCSWVEALRSDFESDGAAKVTIARQPDGRYAMQALFLS